MKNAGAKKVKVGRVLAAAALLTSMAALAACNTVSGAGKDLQEASKNTKEAIEK